MNDQEMNPEAGADSTRPEEASAAAGAGETDAFDPAHPSRHLNGLLDHFRESLANEGGKAYQRWGLGLYHSLSDEEAEAQREALGFEPQDALGHYNRGCLLAAREDFAGAARAFAQAVKLDPELPEALYNLALAQEQSGQAADARRSWNQYVERFAEREDVAEVREHLAELA